MATVTFDFVSACSGGDHVKVDVSVNGGAARRLNLTAQEFFDPLPPEDAETIARGLLRLYRIGKTMGQFKTALASGIAVTVG